MTIINAYLKGLAMLNKTHIRELKDTKLLIDYALHDRDKKESIVATWLSVAAKNLQAIVNDLNAHPDIP